MKATCSDTSCTEKQRDWIPYISWRRDIRRCQCLITSGLQYALTNFITTTSSTTTQTIARCSHTCISGAAFNGIQLLFNESQSRVTKVVEMNEQTRKCSTERERDPSAALTSHLALWCCHYSVVWRIPVQCDRGEELGQNWGRGYPLGTKI